MEHIDNDIVALGTIESHAYNLFKQYRERGLSRYAAQARLWELYGDDLTEEFYHWVTRPVWYM